VGEAAELMGDGGELGARVGAGCESAERACEVRDDILGDQSHQVVPTGNMFVEGWSLHPHGSGYLLHRQVLQSSLFDEPPTDGDDLVQRGA
jgi:hypothetical protein